MLPKTEIDSTYNTSSSVFSPESDYQKRDFRSGERINPFDKNNTSGGIATPSLSSSVAAAAAITTTDDKRSYLSQQTQQKTSTDSFDRNTKIDSQFSSAPTTTISTDRKSSVQSFSSKHSEYRRGVRSNSIAAQSEYSATKYNKKNISNSSLYSNEEEGPTEKEQRAATEGDRSRSASIFTRSSGSLSDAELIFGDHKPNKEKQYSFASSTESDTVFTSRDTKPNYSKSISISADESKPTTYKIYDGIQNHAFQDFDSPVKTSNTNTNNTDDSYDLK